MFVQLKFRHFESCRQNLKPDKQKYMALVRILNLFTWLGNNKKQSCKICLLLCCQILKRELTQALGIMDKQEGVAMRATFIVDPDHIIRFAMINDMNVGRNPKEVLRVLDALQTDELCPCNWQKGDKTL